MEHFENTSIDIDFSAFSAAAVCIRINPRVPAFAESENFSALILKKLSLFDHLADEFRAKNIGAEYDRNADEVRIISIFKISERDTFSDQYIKPIVKQAEQEFSCSLLVGIGLISVNRLHLEKSLQTARDACDLFFFKDGTFFEYSKADRPGSISMDEYDRLSEQAFKAVLIKSPFALDEIGNCLDLIRNIHYGNKQAVIMRAMNYTGEMAYRLHRYNLLEGNFYEMQDKLQEKVLSSMTFAEVKEAILSYYRILLADINSKSRTGRRTVIEQVKAYIRENYMEDLSVNDLAAIACVSSGYFSHMFKAEIGRSYKSYLVDVRMNAALDLLLSSDMSIYEIAEKTGYNNVRNFTEAFRKKFGSSPTAYKKKLQK